MIVVQQHDDQKEKKMADKAQKKNQNNLICIKKKQQESQVRKQSRLKRSSHPIPALERRLFIRHYITTKIILKFSRYREHGPDSTRII